jgi:hypothetical protein
VYSALLVDDLARSDVTQGAPLTPVATPAESLIFTDPDGVKDEADPSDQDPSEQGSDEPHEINSAAVVDAFADLSVACAVLAPDGVTAGDRDRALALATTADIVIFDWLLVPSVGAAAPEASGPGLSRTSASLIKAVAQNDVASGGRLRLMCIYTGNADLGSIVRQVEGVLGEVFPSELILADVDRSRVTAPNMLIVVVPKPRPENSATSVDEGSLPRLLVNEFNRFAADGLLPRVALGAISAVREGAHRVVARFDASMDPAYLSHRALVGQLNGEEFALRLIASELFTVLASAQVEEAVHQLQVDDEVDRYFETTTLPRKVLKGPNSSNTVDVTADSARDVLSVGCDRASLKLQLDGNPKSVKDYPSITSIAYDASDAVEQASRADERLAMLSCLARSPEYDGPSLRPPVLALGSILRSRSDVSCASDIWDYWLCLQPLCDSVRLGEPTQFPLLPLKDVSRKPTASFDFIVPQIKPESGPNEVVRLSTEGRRFRDVKMVLFDPDAAERLVRSTWGTESPGWAFDGRDQTYTWLGDLRLDLAHRTASNVAVHMSRIGLDQSEYLLRRSRS